MIIKKELKVDVPKPPNFINVNGNMESLIFFSDEELEDIAIAWGKKLILRKEQVKRAKEKRE